MLEDQRQLAEHESRWHDIWVFLRGCGIDVSWGRLLASDEICASECADRSSGGNPLGVCANCVAPIGRAFYASGMSTESVLATMFSSPTLNVVVLAMTFTLFPVQVGVLKLATVLVMIFAGGAAAGDRAKVVERR